MPLTLACVGKEIKIRGIGGSKEIRRHLEDLGFLPGSNVTIISLLNENLIIGVKDTRIALSREIAKNIII